MALTQDEFVSAVAKLNEFTRLRFIKWEPTQFPPKARPLANQMVGDFLKVQSSYQAVHEGRLLRITQYVVNTPRLPRKDLYTYVLEVLDCDGNTMFEFPDVPGINDLFRSAQTQEVDIEGFIKKLVAS